MIDFVSVTKYNCKDNLFFGHCKPVGSFAGGNLLFSLEGCDKMKIIWNKDYNVLQIKGSLPYFLKGHNFSFTRSEYIEAINCLDTIFGGVGLWSAEVLQFENGVIFPVNRKPSGYLFGHCAKNAQIKKIYNEKYKGRFIMWQAGNSQIKMYDAGANIKMKQGLIKREIIKESGWDPEQEYLKFEIRYNKPNLLNKGKKVTLEMLQEEEFEKVLADDLLEEYGLLLPASPVKLPSCKKDLTSLDIALISFIEGHTIAEAKEILYQTINRADCLNKADKDARKAQIKKALAKLDLTGESEWELTGQIKEAIKQAGK